MEEPIKYVPFEQREIAYLSDLILRTYIALTPKLGGCLSPELLAELREEAMPLLSDVEREICEG